MKVKIEKAKRISFAKGAIHWTACEPYVENSRAVLIHRVRHVTTHQISEKYRPHLAVDCWCGNGMTGTKKFTFLAEPPSDSLLCARCEASAVAAGLPSTEELTGKHAHIGRVVAVKVCCKDKSAKHEVPALGSKYVA